MRLGQLIKSWSWERRLGVRQTAKILGISPATLSRIQRGAACDSDTLTRILKWILEEDPK